MSETKESKDTAKENRKIKKTQAFIKLAKKRGSKLLDQFRLLNNLGSYAYVVDAETANTLLEKIAKATKELSKIWNLDASPTLPAAQEEPLAAAPPAEAD